MTAPAPQRSFAGSRALPQAGVVKLLVFAITTLGAADVRADELAAHDYLLNCAGCHRFDGSGSEHVPSLSDVGRIAQLPGGRQYLARVPGVAQAPIADARLAALLNWVSRRFGDAAIEPPYQATEVGGWRQRPFTDPRAERASLSGIDESGD